MSESLLGAAGRVGEALLGTTGPMTMATAALLGAALVLDRLLERRVAASARLFFYLVESTTLGNPRMEDCVAGAVRGWEFPRPPGGDLVVVSYPFNFTPSAGSSSGPSSLGERTP
jgi:hypothetical protein